MIGDLINIVGKFIPDGDKAKELEAQIQQAHNDALNQAVKSDTQIRLAEMKSKGISSIWRPIAALIVFSIFFIRFALYHLLLLIVGMFNLPVFLPLLEPLPLEFYGLAASFISIYTFGRSMEKRK